MSTYDSYDTIDPPRRHKSHHHHHHRDREDRDRDDDHDMEPRYVETRETYVRGTAPIVPDSPYESRATDLIRRPGRDESELSIEEVRRDFPPPGTYGSRSLEARDDRYGPPTRSRSMERGYDDYLDDPRDDRQSRKKVVKLEVYETGRRRSLSRNQKIIAGVAGAALAVGGKELWDRRQNHGQAPEDRNILGTAAVAAGGAFAAYEGAELYTKKFAGKEEKREEKREDKREDKRKEKTYMSIKGRNGERAEYYSEASEEEKPKKSRRKSIMEGALGLAGLGAVGKALGGNHDDDRGYRSRRRSRSDSSGRSRRRDRSRGGELEGAAKFQQAAKAALLAGAAEAFRVRKEPGGWTGTKGKRVLTAAIGAGSIDAAADKNPDHHSKRHILEAVVGGLAGNHLINGSRRDLAPDDRRGGRSSRSRSRSRAPNSGGGGAGLAALATAGLGALAGKKLLDNNRSRSRGLDDRDRDDRRSSRRRSPSQDSRDSRDDKRDRRHRSKSVTDYARKGLAALGLGEAASEPSRDDRRRDRDVDDTRSSHKSRRRGSGDSYDDRRESTRGDTRDTHDSPRDSRRRKEGKREKRVAEGKQSESDSDSLGSSSGDEKRVKKMKGKQLLTAGLATVATIHAAHNVYQSYEKREARKKAVATGEMSEQEARKLKSKAVLQDAASIGIAALGIKGAFSEWKEMTDMRHEYKEFAGKKEERHKKRVERQKGLKNDGGQDKTVARRRPRSEYSSASDPRDGGRYPVQGPNYSDGNPYASGGLPAPPIGYAYASQR